MTFSGIDDIAKTEDAADQLTRAADAAAEATDTIAWIAGLVGCADFADACIGDARDAIDICRSTADLLTRKHEELLLSSIGQNSEAASVAKVTNALAAELDSTMADLVDTDEAVYDEARVTELVEQIGATDPDDQAAIDQLTAELQIEIERKTGDFDEAVVAAELMSGGATIDDALAFAAAGDDYDKRCEVLWTAEDGRALAEAIIPTLDLKNKQDLALGTQLYPFFLDLPVAGAGIALELADGTGTPSLEELGILAEWLANEPYYGDVNPAAQRLLDTLHAGVMLNGEPLLAELTDAANASLEDGSKVDAAIEVLMQYATRDPEVGGIEFDEVLLGVIGLTPEQAMGIYGVLLEVQVEQFGELPERASLRSILTEVYLNQDPPLDSASAAMRAMGADEAITNFTQYFDMLEELGAVMAPPYEGPGWIDPNLINTYLAALTDDGEFPPPIPLAGTEDPPMTELERANLIARHNLHDFARFETDNFDEYLQRVRADMERVAAKSGVSLDELEHMLRGIQQYQSEVFTLVGASDGGTDVLTMETADDYIKLSEAPQVDRANIDSFLLSLQGRSFLSKTDIDEIDSFSNGEIDGTLSMQDLVGWLPESGLPIAVQDVLLAAANSGGIDKGGADRLLSVAGPLSLAITALGAIMVPFTGPVGGAVMAAGGLLGSGTAVGVAVYQQRWSDVATESIWLALDLMDGPTQLAELGGVIRARRLGQIKQLYPGMLDEITEEFGEEYVEALLRDASEGLDFARYSAAVSGPLTPERLAALRLVGTDLKTADGVTFRLSDDGFKAVRDGKGAEIERLVANWETLDLEESWTLYQYTVRSRSMDKATFTAKFKNGNLRLNPSVRQMTRVGAADTSGRLLKVNLEAAGQAKPAQGYEAHHIVAINDYRAGPARKMLEDYGIDINEASNGAWLASNPAAANAANLPVGTPHNRLHTNYYYQRVQQRLEAAQASAIMLHGRDNTLIAQALKDELEKIQGDLIAGRPI